MTNINKEKITNKHKPGALVFGAGGAFGCFAVGGGDDCEETKTKKERDKEREINK